MLFVNEQDAIEAGMTHEGVLHGIKVWYHDDALDDDVYYAVPWFILGIAWLYLADAIVEFMCWVTGASVTIEPRMIRKLEKQSLT